MEKPTNETKKQGWSKTKIRRLTFIVVTLVFVTLAVLLFACDWEFLGKWSDFMSQLCIGAATGCFVVALQEVVKEEEEKLENKGKEKLQK